MKNILVLFITLTFCSCLFSQCKSPNYYGSKRVEYTINDTLGFTVFSKCKKPQSVVFSIELFESLGNWQEFDSDIFVDAPKGMKIITLFPMKKRHFVFNTKDIDSVFFEDVKRVRFRIVSNLYSDDKIQIIQTKVVKEFFVDYKE